MVNVDRLRNGNALGNVDRLDDMVNMDGDRSNSCCCCCWSCCCRCCCWCCCRCCCWCCFCGTWWRRKVMPFCGRRLVRNELCHRLCCRFSLLLLLLLFLLWVGGKDQGEQACEKTLLLVLRCRCLGCWGHCCHLVIVRRRRLCRGVKVGDWRWWGRGGECHCFNQLLSLSLGDRGRLFLSCCFRLLLLFLWLQSKGFPLRYEHFFCSISFVVLIVDLNPDQASWRCVYFGHPENKIFGALNKLNRPFGAG